jgi:hypothetical protein
MRHILSGCFILALALAAIVVRGRGAESSFSPYVDTEGKISVPPTYREWAFLGSWHIAPQKGVDDSAGAAGFHNVYTQLSTVEHYRRTGEFPDGAVLVKELLKTKFGKLTTGEVSWATEIEGWFVVVKDTKGRFPNNPLWGNGWGWALFNSDDPANTVTKNWRTDCLGCHTPAQSTDWVFIEGYPILRDASAK